MLQENLLHHEHVTVMPESRTSELRPGMLDDIALMLGRQFSVTTPHASPRWRKSWVSPWPT